MRKKLLSVLLACLVTAVASAGKEESYVLYQGFEDGAIPAGWKQEYGSAIQQSWVVETAGNATYPKDAAAGSKYVALRNNTSQTQYFATKLVTPVFDIQETFQPILVFSHAQPQRTGDVDILRVYYRTSAETRWIKLKEYTDKITTWRTDTISLPGANATYQLAFEGTDNFGRGIALDEIIVRPMPTCDDPNSISTDGLTSNSAMLRWNASLDADSFHVVLSKTQLTDPETATNVVADTFVYDFNYKAEGLERNTTYYIYIQAYCIGSTSEWVHYNFRTKNIAKLPYTQAFDMDYVQGDISHVEYWSHGTSIKKEDGSMEFMPFVNRGTDASYLKYYSYTKTTCLVFSGGHDEESLIQGGDYVYAATPEIDIDDIKNAEVQFWGACYDYIGPEYESGLIVGVMTDPNDFTTFVPVDTVHLEEARTFDRFTIYFDSYKGNGKYIAFASNFKEKENVFYLDDVRIQKAPATKTLTDVKVSQVRASSFVVDANTHGNNNIEVWMVRDTVNAMKSGVAFFDPTKLPQNNTYILKKVTIPANQLPYKVEHSYKGGTFVQVYLRPVGGTDFTIPKKILLPMKWDGAKPLHVGFESDDKYGEEKYGEWEVNQLSYFLCQRLNYSYPFSIITSSPKNSCLTYTYPSGGWDDAYEGENDIHLKKEIEEFSDGTYRCKQQYGDYIALPECDIKQTMMSFYMRPVPKKVSNTSKVAVGVMSDPFDANTFDTVAVYTASDYKWVPICVSFADYNGNGKYPAIMADEAENRYESTTWGDGRITYYLSYNNIDDITLYNLSHGCSLPSDVQAAPADTSVTITWKANGMNKWFVCIYADYDEYKKKPTNVVDSATVTSPTFISKVLKPHTMYYYSVTTLCDKASKEQMMYDFTTECSPYEKIPYIEDFEQWEGGFTNPVQEPMCWTMNRISYCPRVSEYNYHSGSKSFELYYDKESAKIAKASYVALPSLSEPVNKLQMQFYARPDGEECVGDTLFVGVMTDPEDIKTFDTIALFRLSGEDFTEYIVRFEDYSGSGKYIAFMKPHAKAERSIYIDDVKVDFLSDCEKVQGVSARNITTTGADIYWQKGNATTWHILLTTEDMTLGSVVNVDGEKILSIDTVNAMPFHIVCPDPNTYYYVYVRAVCEEKNLGEWSNPTKYKTYCVPLTAGEFGMIDFSREDELDCWIVGVREGATKWNTPSRDSDGYLKMSNDENSDGAYAIMPELDIDSISRLQVSFDAHGGTEAAALREVSVGIISTPADLSTFSRIQTVTLNKVSSIYNKSNGFGFNEGRRYTVRFNGYTGDYNGTYGKRIMFISESGDKENEVYITNIKVDTIATCLEPTMVTASDISVDEAVITWEPLGGPYQVQLTDGTNVLQDTTVQDTTVRFSNLQMLTKYYVQVRTLCSEEEKSPWSNPISFKTTCPTIYSLPYSENFNNYEEDVMPDCWEGYTDDDLPYVDVEDGEKVLVLYRSTSSFCYAVLPKFEGEIKDLLLTLEFRNYNEYNRMCYMEIGVATDITSKEGIDSTFTLIDSVSAPPFDAPNNVWHLYAKAMSTYSGKEGNIVLRAPKADTYDNAGALYIDNVYVEKAPTCFRPTDFKFVSATSKSITLTWKPFGDENTWDVICLPKDSTLDNVAVVPTPILAKNDTFVISGLTPTTTYNFYVRANCGNGDVSSWTNLLTGSTLSIVEFADAHWGFDSLATQVPNPMDGDYKQEKGWIFGNTKTSYVPRIIKDTYRATTETRNYHYSLSDSCALRLGERWAEDNGEYVIIPEINADLNAMQLRFFGRALSAIGSEVSNKDSIYDLEYNTDTDFQRSVKIGTVTDVYDMSTFELLTEYQFKQVPEEDEELIVEDGHWEEVIVPLYGAKGKYIAFVSDYDAPNIVYIDDVVVEKETGCNAPTRVLVTDLQPEKASFSWLSSKKKWNVKIITGKDSIVDQATVDELAWKTDKLTEFTDYIFKVQAICEEGDTSAWASYAFTTPCAPTPQEDYVYNFEENLYNYRDELYLPQCWIGGFLEDDDAEEAPQTIANDASLQYSRDLGNKNGRALRLYNGSWGADEAYVILPETDFSLDSVSLHFWARAAYFFSPMSPTATNRLNEENDEYQRSIIIGAISDVTNFETFVPIDTFTYSQSWSSTDGVTIDKDPSGRDYWEEVLLPLAQYEGKGRIAILYPSNGEVSEFFIDDMEIVHGNFCSAALNLSSSDITASSANLSWKTAGKDSVHLQVATNKEFDTDHIVVDTILVDSKGKYVAKDLEASQSYYFRVLHLCGEDGISDWVVSNEFVTNYVVRFFENFSAVRTYPVNWNRASVVPEEVFSGQQQLQKNFVEDWRENWTRSVSGDGLISSNDIYSMTSDYKETSYNDWLISPIIDLTAVSVNTTLNLSFLLGISSNNDGSANPAADGDKFIVAVSEDAGKTWTRENSTWWSDAKTDNATYSYKAITRKGDLYTIDMTKYIGKQIQVAFINSSTKTATSNRIRMANISINTVITNAYPATVCHWNDYADDNFTIDAMNVAVGTTTFEKYTQAKLDGSSDTLDVLSLIVVANAEKEISATICEGEDYSNDNFDIKNATTSQIYKQKLTGVNTCDSIVVLNLNVLPRLYSTVEKTICQGDFFEFNGVKYYTNTTHTDTLYAVNGCDSIVSLYLSVNAILAGETEEHLCPGESVEFGKFGTITAEGIYVDTVKNALGCDSVATLHVYTHKAAATTVHAAICQGSTYTGGVWSGLRDAGDYPSQQKTVWGCDSIATLHLMVVGEDMAIRDSIALDELPYILNDVELLPVGTTEGTYTENVDLSCGSVTLTIVVGEPTGLHSVFASSLAIAPNPVVVGQAIRVLGSFAADAVVEVVSTTGARIYRAGNVPSPVTIPGIPVSGTYLVTVTSNGQVFQSKLIVR